jgi:hypothetical protein
MICAAPAAARLKVSVASLNFGKVACLGIDNGTEPSNPKSVTISNPKDGSAISGLTIQLAGTDRDDFQITSNTCAPELAAGTNCSVVLVFTPIRLRRRVAMLAISDGDGSHASAVALSGDGIVPRLILPASVSFGAVSVGKTSARAVTVSNPYRARVRIRTITTTGPFTQSNTCGTSLAAGRSCQISVTFTPIISPCNPNGGLETGSLVVANDAAGSPQRAELNGIAVAVSPQTRMFGASAGPDAATAFPLNDTGDLGYSTAPLPGCPDSCKTCAINGSSGLGSFAYTNSMQQGRFGHSGSLLPDGKVLIAGGASDVTINNNAELYQPASAQFVATGQMNPVQGRNPLGLRFLRRFRLARTVEGDRLANERLEGGLFNFISFVEVDRAACVSVETRIEETGRILQRGALGEGKLHDILVGFAGADDAVVRPNRSAHPLPLLDDVRVCFLDELAHSAEGFPAPVPEFGDSFRD